MAAVIKVKYEGETGRLNVKNFGISFEELKYKIYDLLELNGDARAVSLKYIDEDGDVITSASEDDFTEAKRHQLLPFVVEVSRKPKCIHNLGPFGGRGGSSWDDGTFEGIKAITVTMDSTCLRSIQVVYATAIGKKKQFTPAPRRGGRGDSIHTVQFKYPTDKLRKISGYCGTVCDEWTVIKGLTFETNVAKYGPFGRVDWIPFESEIEGEVVALYGRASGFLDSITLRNTHSDKWISIALPNE